MAYGCGAFGQKNYNVFGPLDRFTPLEGGCLIVLGSTEKYAGFRNGPHATMTLTDVPMDVPTLVCFGGLKARHGPIRSPFVMMSSSYHVYGFTESFNLSVTVGMTLSALSQSHIKNWRAKTDSVTCPPRGNT